MNYGYRLTEYWDNDLAEYRYQLHKGFNEDDNYLVVAEGDQLWAKRQAAHYKIKIESADAQS